MGQKDYRLEAVGKVRERAKQERAQAVAERRKQLGEAEAELARRQAEVARCREQQETERARMWEEAREGTAASRLVEHREHLAELRSLEEELTRAVGEQEGKVARCEAEVERALDALREASKEVRVIEKHRERWEEEQRREAVRREQKLDDELASILYERREPES